MDPKPVGLSPRPSVRGRPRSTATGVGPCARCGRNIPRVAARWPEGRLCFTCYFDAIHTRGTCPDCLQDRLLPGPPNADGQPICSTCAGIPHEFHCDRCDVEAGHYRGRLCARCALRDDLFGLLGGKPSNPALAGLVDALCGSDRPESIIVWKRSPKVQALLRGLGDGTIPTTHEGLDGVPGQTTEHLRALLQHRGLLPQRDPDLHRFEQWINRKLDGLPDEVRQPVQHFAVWHHLRRIRAKSAAGESTRGPVHAAKQQVSETIKFLLWLNETHQRTAASCTQQDIDEWLSAGTTTRSHIRTFFMVAAKSRLNTTVTVQHRPAKTSPSLSQDQRIAWIHELLTGTSESLTYRVAGTLLLLYAQPLVKVVALPTTVIDDGDSSMSINLGRHPTEVPEPFASLLRNHLATRPNLRTGAGPDSPWLFPGTRGISASISSAPETAPSENSFSSARRRSSPRPSATARRWRSFMPTRQRSPGPATPAGASAARSQRTAVPPCSLAVGPRPSRLGVASGPLTWHAVDLHKHGLSLIGCIMESLDETGLSTLTDRTSDGHLR